MILKPRRSARYLYTEEGWKRETREERRGQSEESGEHKRRAQSSTASPEGSRETRRPRTTENKQSSMLCYSRVHSREMRACAGRPGPAGRDGPSGLAVDARPSFCCTAPLP